MTILDSAPQAKQQGKELTLRAVALGVSLTLIFTAANVYLGLKIGLTFATSLPAAVISMALLSLFSGSNIRENNIVQTLTSSAGAMASVIFVLPGLVIVGWWTGFPFWISFVLCAAGGILGVLFTIPLRRALVTNSDLPYPEGVAGAEVLKVGSDSRAGNPQAREGLAALCMGACASVIPILLSAMRLAADSVQGFFRLGAGATGFSFSYSLALLGAGHLVGISVGLSMLMGIAIAWAGAVPFLTAMMAQGALPLGDFVTGIWRTQVRFIGAGAMGVAALWSLGKTMKPVFAGLMEMVSAQRGPTALLDHTDRDIPLSVMAGLAIFCTAICAVLIWQFIAPTALAAHAPILTLVAIPIIVIGGFLIAAICGYMAGLIGSSNSPVSGVGILAVVGCSIMLIAFIAPDATNKQALVAAALFITAILFAGAVSSNDNLQDLKTGQLVGSAPWRQQVALIIGVVASSAVVPPVLNLLAHAYGFAGAANLGTITAQPLAAPQANLISALAKGVIGGDIDWQLLGIGALIGAIIVFLDEVLGARGKMRLPPLAAGFGIYLPMAATIPVVVGALLGWWYNRRARTERGRRLGILVASGMIVGESVFGVMNAGLIVAFNRDAPLALVPGDFAYATPIAVIFFIGLTVFLYNWLNQQSAKA